MTNPSLALIVNEAMVLEQMLIESGGEITPEIENALAVNSKSLEEKVDGYVHIIERFEALEAHYKSRADYFKQISGQCKNAIDRLKSNIKFAMQELQVDELKGTDMRLKMTPTTGTMEITDPELVPVEFKTETIVTEIDKKALKEALKNAEIPGAVLTPGFALKAHANTPGTKSKKAGA